MQAQQAIGAKEVKRREINLAELVHAQTALLFTKLKAEAHKPDHDEVDAMYVIDKTA